MRRFALLAVLLLSVPTRLVAQESMWDREGELIEEMLRRPAPPDEAEEERPPLESDRDSFTPATVVVGRSVWLIESAYSYVDNRQGHATNSYPELLARYGISDQIELRLGYNFEIGGAGSDV